MSQKICTCILTKFNNADRKEELITNLQDCTLCRQTIYIPNKLN